MSEWIHRDHAYMPGIEEYWKLPILGNCYVSVYVTNMHGYKPVPARYCLQVCADSRVAKMIYFPLENGLEKAQARVLELAAEYTRELTSAIESALAAQP